MEIRDEIFEKLVGEKCIEQWGLKEQIRQTIEECGELIVALSKYKRKVNASTEDDIREELADVELMINQLKQVFNPWKINQIRRKKVNRLYERLKG